MISRWGNQNLLPDGVPRFAGSRPGTPHLGANLGHLIWELVWGSQMGMHQMGVPHIGSPIGSEMEHQKGSQMGHPRLASKLKKAPHISSQKEGGSRLAPRWGAHIGSEMVVPQISSKMGVPQIGSLMGDNRLDPRWGSYIGEPHLGANLRYPNSKQIWGTPSGSQYASPFLEPI